MLLDQDAEVPSALVHERFVATPLTAATARLDYASYRSSPDVIRVHSDGRWPMEDFTFEDDLALVAVHEDDHRTRRAFTFVLLSPPRTEAVGCLYLNPLDRYLRDAGADRTMLEATPPTAAMVTFWVRQDLQDTDLPDVVARAVDHWIRDDWPLPSHVFRVLPDEHSSRRALDRLDLKRLRLRLPGERRPYLWYQGSPRTS